MISGHLDSGSTLVTGVFRSEEAASAADAALAQEGFPERRVIRPDGESDAPVRAAVAEGYAPRSMVRAYGALLAQGATLVVVKAPFGEGAAAEAAMRTAPGFEAPPPTPPTRDPAPFSRAFGLPVLASARSHTELASRWSFSDFLGLSLLSRNPAPLSSALGMSTLSTGERPRRTGAAAPVPPRNPAPLSSALGLSTLVSGKRPWTTSFGLPLLSANATPLSSFLGLPVLTRKQR